MIGKSYFQGGQYDEAITQFQKVIDEFPTSQFVDDAVYAQADCYYNLGRYDNAIKQYNMVINNFSNSDLIDDAVSGIQWALLQSRDRECKSGYAPDRSPRPQQHVPWRPLPNEAN